MRSASMDGPASGRNPMAPISSGARGDVGRGRSILRTPGLSTPPKSVKFSPCLSSSSSSAPPSPLIPASVEPTSGLAYEIARWAKSNQANSHHRRTPEITCRKADGSNSRGGPDPPASTSGTTSASSASSGTSSRLYKDSGPTSGPQNADRPASGLDSSGSGFPIGEREKSFFARRSARLAAPEAGPF